MEVKINKMALLLASLLRGQVHTVSAVPGLATYTTVTEDLPAYLL